jgi:hypothetical protein
MAGGDCCRGRDMAVLSDHCDFDALLTIVAVEDGHFLAFLETRAVRNQCMIHRHCSCCDALHVLPREVDSGCCSCAVVTGADPGRIHRRCLCCDALPVGLVAGGCCHVLAIAVDPGRIHRRCSCCDALPLTLVAGGCCHDLVSGVDQGRLHRRYSCYDALPVTLVPGDCCHAVVNGVDLGMIHRHCLRCDAHRETTETAVPCIGRHHCPKGGAQFTTLAFGAD